MKRYILLIFMLGVVFSTLKAQSITLVELNCENLFDTQHDEGKQDKEFTPNGMRRWTRSRYWRKLNHVGQTILSCSEELPDIVALAEVENDSVLHYLTRRSLLRNAGYEYLMTNSPDVRGLDVALLYQPSRFRPLCYDTIAITPLPGMRPTRDILYVKGELISSDTIHIFVLHAPSRYGGEELTRAHRMQVANSLLRAVDSIGVGNNIIVTGDFNDYCDNHSLRLLGKSLRNATRDAKGRNGAKGTYRYQGEWRSLDHVLMSPKLYEQMDTAYINDALFLLEKEKKYGGMRPRRTFKGYTYDSDGFSDHLPLIVRVHF